MLRRSARSGPLLLLALALLGATAASGDVVLIGLSNRWASLPLPPPPPSPPLAVNHVPRCRTPHRPCRQCNAQRALNLDGEWWGRAREFDWAARCCRIVAAIPHARHPFPAGTVLLAGDKNLMDGPGACCAACKLRGDCNVWTYCAAAEGAPASQCRGGGWWTMQHAAHQTRAIFPLCHRLRLWWSLPGVHPKAGAVKSQGNHKTAHMGAAGLACRQPPISCPLSSAPNLVQDWNVDKYARVISRGHNWVSGYIGGRCPGTDPTKLLALQAICRARDLANAWCCYVRLGAPHLS